MTLNTARDIARAYEKQIANEWERLNEEPVPMKSLSYGILADPLGWESWQRLAVANLESLPDVELKFICFNTDYKKKAKKNYSHILYYLFKKISKSSQNPGPINIRSFQGKYLWGDKDYLNSPEFLEKARGVDFILRFGFGILKGEVLKAPGLGIWSFHIGHRGGPPGFWEIYRNEDVTYAMMQVITNQLDSGIPLKDGLFKTNKVNINNSLNEIRHTMALWPRQQCLDYMNASETGVPSSKYYSEYCLAEGIIHKPPSNLKMLKFFVILLRNTIRLKFESLFQRRHWHVGIVEKDIEKCLDDSWEVSELKVIKPKDRNHFIADPFGFGSGYILVEDFSFRKNKGIISESTGLGRLIPILFPDEADEINLHLNHVAYPYTFTHDMKWYCLPSSPDREHLVLYSIDKDAFWHFEKILLFKKGLVDASLIYYQDYWWLFSTVADDFLQRNLYVWYSKELLGPYTEHKNNPVKVNIKSSRSAGTPFIVNSILYRPAQNNSESYGKSITINAVEILTPDSFAEWPVKEIKAPEGFNGIHTLSWTGTRTLVDLRKDIYTLRKVTDFIWRKVGK